MIRRRSVGLLTSFRVKEFGMSGYEPLSWASATLVERFSSDFPRKFHVLANGHVVTPWRYLPLYSREQVEWLQHVKQEHCRYQLQVLSESGDVTYQTQVANPFPHAHRDAASLYLINEDDDLPDVIERVEPAVLSSKRLADGGDIFEIAGHSLEGAGANVMRPLLVEGKLKLRTDKQTFLDTAMTLPQGMCGGPAIFKDDATCAGIIDGIVSPQVQSGDDPFKQAVAGAASIVPSSELLIFVRQAENNLQLRKSIQEFVLEDPQADDDDDDIDDDMDDGEWDPKASPAESTGSSKTAAVP